FRLRRRRLFTNRRRYADEVELRGGSGRPQVKFGGSDRLCRLPGSGRGAHSEVQNQPEAEEEREEEGMERDPAAEGRPRRGAKSRQPVQDFGPGPSPTQGSRGGGGTESDWRAGHGQ